MSDRQQIRVTFSNLRIAPQQQSTQERHDEADYEEHGKDLLWGEDGSECGVSAAILPPIANNILPRHEALLAKGRI